MGWALLLGAALEAGLGLIATVGFEEAAQNVKERLLGTSEKARQQALQKALDAAAQDAGYSKISSLLHEAQFQEEVIAALLDPVAGFDVAAVAVRWEEQLPIYKLALRRFFNALERALTGDEIWGPVLERYQDLRFQQGVMEALQARQLDLPPQQIVHQLNMKLTGAGALAVSGDVERVVQIFVETLVINRSGPAQDASLRNSYLQEVVDEANLLPWSIINIDHADPGRGADMRLADVYTALDTTSLRKIDREDEYREFMARIHEAKRIPAQEMANEHSCLLIMGDPGSGKSTFVKHLTYVQAQANLAGDAQDWLAQLEGWTCGAHLPVRIELRHLAAFATAEKITTGTVQLFTRYLCALLADWGLADFDRELLAALRDRETSLLVFLDGLDEVATDQRQLVVDMVNALRRRYGWHRYLVTCRPYAYVGQPWKLRSFHEVTLAPFSPEQSDLFVDNWYRQLAERGRFTAVEAQQRIADLQRKIKRPDLKEMAERPLLLTVMTQLHAFRGKLPEDRTELYADAVDLLLHRWEGRTNQVGVIEQLDMSHLKMSDLQAGIYDVAYRAHAAQQDGETADIGEGDLRQWLQEYLDGDWNKAGIFVEYIRERAGLLVRHKTDAYTFPHRTFQEFLAACYLVNTDDYSTTAARLVREERSRWREVFLLAAGHAARNHRLGQAIAAVNALCPQDVDRCAERPADRWRNASLAGEALLEIGLVGVRREETGRTVLERVQAWLVQALRQDQMFAPTERAAAGRVLAKLGDPRVEVLDPMRIEWKDIPAGPFIMGGEDGYEDEKPQHRLDLGYAFRISRFPITNAQFKVFVDDGGYGDERYWTEAKMNGRWRDGKVIRGLYRLVEKDGKQVVEEFKSEEGTEPVNWGEPFNLSNHPVTGINWYESLAFTRWLTEGLQAAGVLSQKQAVWLPSEAEWERAARGIDGWLYPFGNDADSGLTNCKEIGLEATTAVGSFPGGASTDGVEEMSGNVWEWTRNLWGTDVSDPEFTYPYVVDDGRELLVADDNVFRVVRGGSWYGEHKMGRCAVRGGGLMGNRSPQQRFSCGGGVSPLPHRSLTH